MAVRHPRDPDELLSPWLRLSDDSGLSRMRQAVAEFLLSDEATPDDWNSFSVLGSNGVWRPALRWIVRQPNCDSSTALRVFWKCDPDLPFYAPPPRRRPWWMFWQKRQHFDYAASRGLRANDPMVIDWEDRRALAAEILARWLGGGFQRQELAYDPSFWTRRVDFARMEKLYGRAAVERAMPAALRVARPGRQPNSAPGWNGIPERLWRATQIWPEELRERAERPQVGLTPAPSWPIDATANLQALVAQYRRDAIDGAEVLFAEWLLSGASTPADWHRHALYGNWDYGYETFHWIIQQPTCDRATALHIFWIADPIETPYQAGMREVAWQQDWQGRHFDLVADIRERWLANFYTQSEFGFTLGLFGETERGPSFQPDYVRWLASVYDDFNDRIPGSMLQSILGPQVTSEASPEGIPERFWERPQNSQAATPGIP